MPPKRQRCEFCDKLISHHDFASHTLECMKRPQIDHMMQLGDVADQNGEGNEHTMPSKKSTRSSKTTTTATKRTHSGSKSSKHVVSRINNVTFDDKILSTIVLEDISSNDDQRKNPQPTPADLSIFKRQRQPQPINNNNSALSSQPQSALLSSTRQHNRDNNYPNFDNDVINIDDDTDDNNNDGNTGDDLEELITFRKHDINNNRPSDNTNTNTNNNMINTVQSELTRSQSRFMLRDTSSVALRQQQYRPPAAQSVVLEVMQEDFVEEEKKRLARVSKRTIPKKDRGVDADMNSPHDTTTGTGGGGKQPRKTKKIIISSLDISTTEGTNALSDIPVTNDNNNDGDKVNNSLGTNKTKKLILSTKDHPPDHPLADRSNQLQHYINHKKPDSDEVVMAQFVPSSQYGVSSKTFGNGNNKVKKTNLQSSIHYQNAIDIDDSESELIQFDNNVKNDHHYDNNDNNNNKNRDDEDRIDGMDTQQLTSEPQTSLFDSSPCPINEKTLTSLRMISNLTIGTQTNQSRTSTEASSTRFDSNNKYFSSSSTSRLQPTRVHDNLSTSRNSGLGSRIGSISTRITPLGNSQLHHDSLSSLRTTSTNSLSRIQSISESQLDSNSIQNDDDYQHQDGMDLFSSQDDIVEPPISLKALITSKTSKVITLKPTLSQSKAVSVTGDSQYSGLFSQNDVGMSHDDSDEPFSVESSTTAPAQSLVKSPDLLESPSLISSDQSNSDESIRMTGQKAFMRKGRTNKDYHNDTRTTTMNDDDDPHIHYYDNSKTILVSETESESNVRDQNDEGDDDNNNNNINNNNGFSKMKVVSSQNNKANHNQSDHGSKANQAAMGGMTGSTGTKYDISSFAKRKAKLSFLSEGNDESLSVRNLSQGHWGLLDQNKNDQGAETFNKNFDKAIPKTNIIQGGEQTISWLSNTTSSRCSSSSSSSIKKKDHTDVSTSRRDDTNPNDGLKADFSHFVDKFNLNGSSNAANCATASVSRSKGSSKNQSKVGSKKNVVSNNNASTDTTTSVTSLPTDNVKPTSLRQNKRSRSSLEPHNLHSDSSAQQVQLSLLPPQDLSNNVGFTTISTTTHANPQQQSSPDGRPNLQRPHPILPHPLLDPIDFNSYIHDFYQYSTTTSSLPALSHNRKILFKEQQRLKARLGLNPTQGYPLGSLASIPNPHDLHQSISVQAPIFTNNVIAIDDNFDDGAEEGNVCVKKKISIKDQKVLSGALSAVPIKEQQDNMNLINTIQPKQTIVTNNPTVQSHPQQSSIKMTNPLTTEALGHYANIHRDIIERQMPFQIENIAVLLANSLPKLDRGDDHIGRQLGDDDDCDPNNSITMKSDDMTSIPPSLLNQFPQISDILLDSNIVWGTLTKTKKEEPLEKAGPLPPSSFNEAFSAIKSELTVPFLNMVENTLNVLDEHQMEHTNQVYQLELRKKGLELYQYKLHYQQYLLQQMASFAQEYAVVTNDLIKLQNQFPLTSLLDLNQQSEGMIDGKSGKENKGRGSNVLKNNHTLSFQTRLPVQMFSNPNAPKDQNDHIPTTTQIYQGATISTTIKTKPHLPSSQRSTASKSNLHHNGNVDMGLDNNDHNVGLGDRYNGITVDSIDSSIKFDPKFIPIDNYFLIKTSNRIKDSNINDSDRSLDNGDEVENIDLNTTSSSPSLDALSQIFLDETRDITSAIQETNNLIKVLHKYSSSGWLGEDDSRDTDAPMLYSLFSSLSPPASNFHPAPFDNNSINGGDESNCDSESNERNNHKMDKTHNNVSQFNPALLSQRLNIDLTKLPNHLKAQMVSLPHDIKSEQADYLNRPQPARDTGDRLHHAHVSVSGGDSASNPFNNSTSTTPTTRNDSTNDRYNNESIDNIILAHLSRVPLTIIALLGITLPLHTNSAIHCHFIDNQSQKATEHDASLQSSQPHHVQELDNHPSNWYHALARIIDDYKNAPVSTRPSCSPLPADESRELNNVVHNTQLASQQLSQKKLSTALSLLSSPTMSSTYLFQKIINITQNPPPNTPIMPILTPPQPFHNNSPNHLLYPLFSILKLTPDQFISSMWDQYTLLEGDVQLLNRIKSHLFDFLHVISPNFIPTTVLQQQLKLKQNNNIDNMNDITLNSTAVTLSTAAVSTPITKLKTDNSNRRISMGHLTPSVLNPDTKMNKQNSILSTSHKSINNDVLLNDEDTNNNSQLIKTPPLARLHNAVIIDSVRKDYMVGLEDQTRFTRNQNNLFVRNHNNNFNITSNNFPSRTRSQSSFDSSFGLGLYASQSLHLDYSMCDNTDSVDDTNINDDSKISIDQPDAPRGDLGNTCTKELGDDDSTFDLFHGVTLTNICDDNSSNQTNLRNQNSITEKYDGSYDYDQDDCVHDKGESTHLTYNHPTDSINTLNFVDSIENKDLCDHDKYIDAHNQADGSKQENQGEDEDDWFTMASLSTKAPENDEQVDCKYRQPHLTHDVSIDRDNYDSYLNRIDQLYPTVELNFIQNDEGGVVDDDLIQYHHDSNIHVQDGNHTNYEHDNNVHEEDFARNNNEFDTLSDDNQNCSTDINVSMNRTSSFIIQHNLNATSNNMNGDDNFVDFDYDEDADDDDEEEEEKMEISSQNSCKSHQSKSSEQQLDRFAEVISLVESVEKCDHHVIDLLDSQSTLLSTQLTTRSRDGTSSIYIPMAVKSTAITNTPRKDTMRHIKTPPRQTTRSDQFTSSTQPLHISTTPIRFTSPHKQFSNPNRLAFAPLHNPSKEQKNALKELIESFSRPQLLSHLSAFEIAPSSSNDFKTDLTRDCTALYEYIIAMSLFYDTKMNQGSHPHPNSSQTSSSSLRHHIHIIVPGTKPTIISPDSEHTLVERVSRPPINSPFLPLNIQKCPLSSLSMINLDHDIDDPYSSKDSVPRPSHQPFTRKFNPPMGRDGDEYDEYDEYDEGDDTLGPLSIFTPNEMNQMQQAVHGTILSNRLSDAFAAKTTKQKEAKQNIVLDAPKIKAKKGKPAKGVFSNQPGSSLNQNAMRMGAKMSQIMNDYSTENPIYDDDHDRDADGQSLILLTSRNNNNTSSPRLKGERNAKSGPKSDGIIDQKNGQMTKAHGMSKNINRDSNQNFELSHDDGNNDGDDVDQGLHKYHRGELLINFSNTGNDDDGDHRSDSDTLIFTYDDALSASNQLSKRIIHEKMHLVLYDNTLSRECGALKKDQTTIPTTSSDSIANRNPTSSNDYMPSLDIDTLRALDIDPEVLKSLDMAQFNKHQHEKAQEKQKQQQHSYNHGGLNFVHQSNTFCHFPHHSTDSPFNLQLPTQLTPFPNLSLCFDCLVTQWFHLPSQRLILHRISLQHPLPQCNMYHLFDYYHNIHHKTLDQIVTKMERFLLETQKLSVSLQSNSPNILQLLPSSPPSLVGLKLSPVSIHNPTDQSRLLIQFLIDTHQFKKEILLLLTKQCFNHIPLASSLAQWNKLRGMCIALLLIIQHRVSECSRVMKNSPIHQTSPNCPPQTSNSEALLSPRRFIGCNNIPCNCFITQQFYSGLGIPIIQTSQSPAASNPQNSTKVRLSTVTTSPMTSSGDCNATDRISVQTIDDVIHQLSHFDYINGHVLFFIFAHLDLLILQPSVESALGKLKKSPSITTSTTITTTTAMATTTHKSMNNNINNITNNTPYQNLSNTPYQNLSITTLPQHNIDLIFISTNDITKIYSMIKSLLGMLRYPHGLSKPKFNQYLNKQGLHYYMGYQNQ